MASCAGCSARICHSFMRLIMVAAIAAPRDHTLIQSVGGIVVRNNNQHAQNVHACLVLAGELAFTFSGDVVINGIKIVHAHGQSKFTKTLSSNWVLLPTLGGA